MRDYYCNQKFTWLKIDAEKQTTYSCCESNPDNINIEWLKKNPGMIFNTDKLKEERQNMLDNKRIKSCEKACWVPEDIKLSSRRIKFKGYEKTNVNVNTMPSTLDITLSGDCNLTCSYCCKEFSSAWRNDILKNGSYPLIEVDKNRYQASSHDIALRYVSQQNRMKLENFSLIEQEIDLMLPNLKKVIISGGEPFLHHRLLKILERLKNIPVLLFTGLGVNKNKFRKLLEKINAYNNVSLLISAESTKENYEFNRFGNTWKNFLECVDVIKDIGIKYKFNTTYSNLTVLDFVDFNLLFDNNHSMNLVYEPEFMRVWVLDDFTKQALIKKIEESEVCTKPNSKIITKLLTQTATELDRKNFETFVKEFCRRRNIQPNFMPIHLKKWLNLV